MPHRALCNAHCSPLTFFGKNDLYGGLFGGYFARLVEVTVNMKAWFNAVFDGLKKVENIFFPNLNGLAENRCQSRFGNKLLHCKEGPSELILQYTSVPGFPARKSRYLVRMPVPGIPGILSLDGNATSKTPLQFVVSYRYHYWFLFRLPQRREEAS